MRLNLTIVGPDGLPELLMSNADDPNQDVCHIKCSTDGTLDSETIIAGIGLLLSKAHRLPSSFSAPN